MDPETPDTSSSRSTQQSAAANGHGGKPNGAAAAHAFAGNQVEDYDTQRRAIVGRLRSLVRDNLSSHDSAALRARVLECADALEQLHFVDAHERQLALQVQSTTLQMQTRLAAATR